MMPIEFLTSPCYDPEYLSNYHSIVSSDWDIGTIE